MNNSSKQQLDIKKYKNVEVLFRLNLIKNQVNYYRDKLIIEIYIKHFASIKDEKIKKTLPTLEQFKLKISKKKRKNKTSSANEKYKYDDEKCNFILWNKGHLRQCQFNKINTTSYCKKHQTTDNLLEDYFFDNLENNNEKAETK